MQLRQALRLSPGQAVAFVGAGGKTGAIRRLVIELARPAQEAAGGSPGGRPSGEGRQPPALITTTTRLGLGQADLAAHHLIDPGPDELAGIPRLLQSHGSLLMTGPAEAGKWTPPSEAALRILADHTRRLGALLLIEADGARGRSLKAPADHEPVIPEFVDLVVPIAGLDVLGQPIDSAAVHRPERVAAVLGLEPADTIGQERLAQLLASPEGGMKGVPPGAEARVLLNRSTPDRLQGGRELARALLSRRPAAGIHAVLLAELQGEDPVLQVLGRVAGIVLAAGSSSRLGQPKQLIEWRGRPLVAHAVAAAVEGGLDPVIVVLGEAGEQVRQALAGQPVEFIENADWDSGQSSSVQVGLRAVQDRAEAAAFILADTPFVGGGLVRALLERHRRTLAPLVAPWAGGRRANPVFFDRSVFSRLLALGGDAGGRVLFDELHAEWVEWDDSITLDLDTPKDLARLRELE